MKTKQKSWLWKLTWPFAHNNYTTVNGALYHPKGWTPGPRMLAHEKIHAEQQAKMWFPFWAFLYLAVLPILWNPWRKKWETEAFRKGSTYDEDTTRELLRTYRYGWLL